MFLFFIVSFLFFYWNVFAVNNCTRLKYTFGIRAIIRFKGMPLWSRVWLRIVISLVKVGDMWYRFFRWKEMESSSKMEIKKFNGKIFALWKLKMEDLLVERYHWIMVDLGIALTWTSSYDWKKLDQKAKSTMLGS